MTLLSSLLPGVRALRAPLAAGFIWLLSLWLAVEPLVPEHTPTAGIGGSIARMEGLGQAIGWLVMVSFAAYLVGSILMVVVPRVGMRMVELVARHETYYDSTSGEYRWRYSIRWARGGEEDNAPPRPPGKLVRYINRVMGPRAGPSQDAAWRLETYAAENGPGRNLEGTMREIAEEWEILPLTIAGTNPTLYTEIDRYRAEAEFRTALQAPLMALGIVVAIRTGTSWAAPLAAVLASATVCALILAADDARRNADVLIANGVTAGLITPRAFNAGMARNEAVGFFGASSHTGKADARYREEAHRSA